MGGLWWEGPYKKGTSVLKYCDSVVNFMMISETDYFLSIRILVIFEGELPFVLGKISLVHYAAIILTILFCETKKCLD